MTHETDQFVWVGIGFNRDGTASMVPAQSVIATAGDEVKGEFACLHLLGYICIYYHTLPDIIIASSSLFLPLLFPLPVSLLPLLLKKKLTP